MVMQGKIGSSRVKLQYKDWNKLKKLVEQIILELGGRFEDSQSSGGNKVKAKYYLGDKVMTKIWHQTPSANSAKKNAINDLRKMFVELGIENSSHRLRLVKLVGEIDFSKKYPYSYNFDDLDDIISEIESTIE